MESQMDSTLSQYRHITLIVKKNLDLLEKCDHPKIDPESLVRFNNKMVISDCKPFLEAIKNEIGGEIIEDSTIGLFLYYGDLFN